MTDESKMYVYVQDIVDKWKRDFALEMAKKKHKTIDPKHIDHLVRNSINSSLEFQRLYMNGNRTLTTPKRGVPKNE